MKNLLLTLAIITSLNLMAQKFEAGLVGGFTTSQITGDGLAGFDKAGARLGAYITYPLRKKKMNFEVGMQYLQKGSRMPSEKNSISNYKMDLHYLELPFTINYALTNGLILESGLGLGVLLKYTEEDANGPLDGEIPNTLAVDFILGLQYQVFKHLKFNLRYGNSIIPIRKESEVTEHERNKDWSSSLVTFALMYQISR
tara:strand:+ start:338 stop:934 length:597 start_codon:yes stop_codon:yes gene_type:complete